MNFRKDARFLSWRGEKERPCSRDESCWQRAGLWGQLPWLIGTSVTAMNENGKRWTAQVIQMLLKGIRFHPSIFYTVPRWDSNSYLLLQVKWHVLVYEVPAFRCKQRYSVRTPWTGHVSTYLAIPNASLVHILVHFPPKTVQAFSEHSIIRGNTWVYYRQH